MACSRCGKKAGAQLPHTLPPAIKKAEENPNPPRALTTHILATVEEVEVDGISEPLRVANPAPSLNTELLVQVHDLPGPGGGHHEYTITRKHTHTPGTHVTRIDFQKGPIKEVGVNGVSNEALLAIVLDRLLCFASGNYADDFTRTALQFVANALDSLHERTYDRHLREVEGTYQK